MAGSIRVTPEMMVNVSQSVDSKIDEWQRSVNKIYSLVQEMDTMWDGMANDTLNNTFQENIPKYNALTQMMTEYSTAIKQAANTYVNGEEEVKNIVSRKR
ncbi:MAG: WXG100 family type VII secretion target [Provencibacterium sp.]|jgi:WXG100 family type VII secretion target|nr:WXG100 family type VII secretion target [Provencibacterium sp.]